MRALDTCIRLEKALASAGVPLTGDMGGADYNPPMMRLILRQTIKDETGCCDNHIHSPEECPQAHICEHCGEPLSEHRTTAMHCPTIGKRFSADVATRAKFPAQYPEVGA